MAFADVAGRFVAHPAAVEHSRRNERIRCSLKFDALMSIVDYLRA